MRKDRNLIKHLECFNPFEVRMPRKCITVPFTALTSSKIILSHAIALVLVNGRVIEYGHHKFHIRQLRSEFLVNLVIKLIIGIIAIT